MLTAPTTPAAPKRKPTRESLEAIARLYPRKPLHRLLYAPPPDPLLIAGPGLPEPAPEPEPEPEPLDPEAEAAADRAQAAADKQARAEAFICNHNLTLRYIEVVQRAATGQNNPQIASAMGLSEDTIKTHLRRAFARIGARDRAHAVLILLRAGLITPPVIADDTVWLLTEREAQVLGLVANGHSNLEAGDAIGLSGLTIKSHLARIARKMGMGDRAQMTAAAFAGGIVR